MEHYKEDLDREHQINGYDVTPSEILSTVIDNVEYQIKFHHAANPTYDQYWTIEDNSRKVKIRLQELADFPKLLETELRRRYCDKVCGANEDGTFNIQVAVQPMEYIDEFVLSGENCKCVTNDSTWCGRQGTSFFLNGKEIREIVSEIVEPTD